MIKYILVLTLLILPSLSNAQDAMKDKVQIEKDGEVQLEISKADCDKLPSFGKTENKYVSAEYKAGLDVYGNKVVPADANEYSINIPKEIKMNISIDIAKKYGLDSSGIELGKLDLGTLEIKDGKAYINSNQVSDEDIRMISDICK